MNVCDNCMCNRCGNMYQCEAILDMVIYYDSSNHIECTPITSCKNFLSYRNFDLNKNWNCPIESIIGGES